jgi:hypothetical protein
MTDLVSKHLGMDNITRQNMLERNLFLPREIFGNFQNTKAIVICDGTYLYIEKSRVTGSTLRQMYTMRLVNISKMRRCQIVRLTGKDAHPSPLPLPQLGLVPIIHGAVPSPCNVTTPPP